MRVLALVNGLALAHVSRVLEVAKALRSRGHDILFAGGGEYLSVAERDGFRTFELPFIPKERVQETLRSQKAFSARDIRNFFPEKELCEYVEAELALYRRVKPDILLVDNRLTVTTSAELAGLRVVSIFNAHLSMYRKIPFFSLEGALGAGLGAMADRVENAVENLFYDRLAMGGLNSLRKKYGLKRNYAYGHEEGALNLIADIPEFNPTSTLSGNTRYVGPLTWHNKLPVPACAGKLDPEKKTIYVTIGSAGMGELVPQLNAFARRDIQVVVATGHEPVPGESPLPANVFLEKLVNADELFPLCSAILCHGGNGTIYQALTHGLPVVGVATHEEQYYGVKMVQRLGLGLGLRAKELKQRGFGQLVRYIDEVLDNEKYQREAKRFQSLLKGWNAPERSADLMEQFAAGVSLN